MFLAASRVLRGTPLLSAWRHRRRLLNGAPNPIKLSTFFIFRRIVRKQTKNTHNFTNIKNTHSHQIHIKQNAMVAAMMASLLCVEAAVAGRPNVILSVVDDLGRALSRPNERNLGRPSPQPAQLAGRKGF